LNRQNKHLSVVEKVSEGNVVEFRKPKNLTITKRLEKIRADLAETVGAKDPLSLLINMALDTGRLRDLKTALEAYKGQPDQFRRALENGWVPLNEEGLCQVLKIQGNEEGNGNIWFHCERSVVEDCADDGLALPDVGIYIAEGTPKEIVIKILGRAITQVSKDWDTLLKDKSILA
jgi:hypothetical protein